ncbi:RES family NAD+ phosphorylase [Pseudomonas putida]|uniref:RES family NAD+ phosphorylase n=1 Tax=Pseudomonas putida TaxID=303 RepID=A0ABD7BBM8_PSEPU|nr:RES domain-containing protein [Pseudomonas putida]MBH3452951.1 RES family NAD+ phosphorylase [Pseudomonas putida]QOC96961.1 RES family NAD+ phosphorylase [Pseudomonas putida]
MYLDYVESIFDEIDQAKTERDITQGFLDLLANYKILSFKIERGSMLWRARKISSTRYNKISELLYPPTEYVRYGRLNDIGEQVLYTSLRQETALAEISAKAGDLIQIAGFRIQPDKELMISTIGDFAHIQKTGRSRLFGSDPELAITKMLNDTPREIAKAFIYTDKFLAYTLANVNASQEDYLRTRTLGKLIYQRAPTNGIAFPSVKDKDGYNIFFNKSSSDEYLQNVCSFVVRINKERRYGMMDFEIIESVMDLQDDGTFIWDDASTPTSFGIYNLTQSEHKTALIHKDDPNGLLTLIHGK